MDVTNLIAGGSFLISASVPGEVYTPEDFSEEHRLAVHSLNAFLDAEIEPRAADL